MIPGEVELNTLAKAIAQEQLFTNQTEQLIEKFQARDARVAVVGLGYGGLPLALTFAEAGFSVVGIDLNHERVACLNAGQSYISDVSQGRLAALLNTNIEQVEGDNVDRKLTVTGHLTATTSFDVLYDTGVKKLGGFSI